MRAFEAKVVDGFTKCARFAIQFLRFRCLKFGLMHLVASKPNMLELSYISLL